MEINLSRDFDKKWFPLEEEEEDFGSKRIDSIGWFEWISWKCFSRIVKELKYWLHPFFQHNKETVLSSSSIWSK
jgi:hypothetical protein